MLKKLSHPMIYANDLQRAVKFYSEKLGFSISFHIPDAYASLFHKEMNCRLDLHPSEADSKDVGFGPIIYFATDDMNGDLEKLKAAGVKTGTPKRVGDSPMFCTFWDSEGNALGLEELRR